ncbi:hypothetical protein HFP15_01860 [Amycolatopsis sp. K13G38]|uniref:Uncharacterized protein n=1 Tax=Amycolatopsis acididurans TaxID=2724524 RepID=A0ABX1J013_9PSEU|nr:hypothetical protein [Amycolatopsis acididurans]NKQ51622.1 hypothetical protein [Amycolatopsis acididurans]
MAKHRIDDQSKNGRWGGPELVRPGDDRPAAQQHPARHDRDRDRRDSGQVEQAVAEDVTAG